MKKLQRAGAVLILLTMSFSLLSCSKGVAGTYVNSKESKQTIQLKSDGSFALYETGNTTAAATGTYKVEGTVITFTINGMSKTGTGKIENGVLTDPDGVTWNKQ